MENMYQNNPVFVWRSGDKIPNERLNNQCIYCKFRLKSDEIQEIPSIDKKLKEIYSNERDWVLNFDDGSGLSKEQKLKKFEDYYAAYQALCEKCGWWINYLRIGNTSVERTTSAALLNFDLNDSKLALPEILSHLSKKYSDIYNVSSYKFELIIGEVYSNMGYKVKVSKQTRDGGIDIICLDEGSKTLIIECKRYSKEKKVSISAVDRLFGVMIRSDAQEAHLVTSSFFSSPSLNAADDIAKRNYSFKLIDAHELFKLLNIYSDPTLTPKDLSLIFKDENLK